MVTLALVIIDYRAYIIYKHLQNCYILLLNIALMCGNLLLKNAQQTSCMKIITTYENRNTKWQINSLNYLVMKKSFLGFHFLYKCLFSFVLIGGFTPFVMRSNTCEYHDLLFLLIKCTSSVGWDTRTGNTSILKR